MMAMSLCVVRIQSSLQSKSGINTHSPHWYSELTGIQPSDKALFQVVHFGLR